MTNVPSLHSQGLLELTISEIFSVSTVNEPTATLNPQKVQRWKPQPSLWKPLCHPRVGEVSLEVDGYFLHHWKFPSKKAEKVFVEAAFSRLTCLYFPLAKDDRIHFACRLLTVLFLIDGKNTWLLWSSRAANNKIQPNWG